MSASPYRGQLLLRADAGPRIGNGHVMRCLALAQAWQDAGGEATFACVELPESLRRRLQAEGCRVRAIDAPAGSSLDARRLASLERQVGARAIVLDGYGFGSGYQRMVHAIGRRVVFIDDDGRHGTYHADVILNQNLHAERKLYPRHPPSARLLLGTQYVLLRREFRQFSLPRRTFPKVARRILVMLGGTGLGTANARMLQSVASLAPLSAEVLVVAADDAAARALRRLAAGPTARLRSESDPHDLPRWMAWADAAVTAAGSTVWELLSLGAPTLTFPISTNQRPIALLLQHRGLALVANPLSRRSFDAAFARLLEDAALRKTLSAKGRLTVRSRRGAERVVKSLLAVPES